MTSIGLPVGLGPARAKVMSAISMEEIKASKDMVEIADQISIVLLFPVRFKACEYRVSFVTDDSDRRRSYRRASEIEDDGEEVIMKNYAKRCQLFEMLAFRIIVLTRNTCQQLLGEKDIIFMGKLVNYFDMLLGNKEIDLVVRCLLC